MNVQYQALLQSEPVIDKGYLAGFLQLKQDEHIAAVEIISNQNTQTARVIRLKAAIHCVEGLFEKALFIKTSKPTDPANTYQAMCMRECGFYRLCEAQGKQLPVPHCYDAHTNENSFVLVLDDVSGEYAAVDQEALSSSHTWLRCADSLACFHAAFWEADCIGTGELAPESKQALQETKNHGRACLSQFLAQNTDVLDEAMCQVFTHALLINELLIDETNARIAACRHVTLQNGDSHIYNFLLPKEEEGTPLLVDFQFWGAGLGAGDVSHLTRVGFCDEQKQQLQMELLRHYHARLMHYGVKHYPWDTCLRDYRMCVAAMLLIPMWQAVVFHVPREQWLPDVAGLLNNYRYMLCDTLMGK